MQNLPDFSGFFPFFILTIILFLIITARYFIVAGLFQLFFYKWFKQQYARQKLSEATVPAKQFYKEVKWSVVTSVIFAVAGACTFVLWQKGLTKVYFDVGQYGLWYLPVSLLAALFIHETYYYFLHRWMHRPAVFRLIHKTHHESNTTSAWTAFSFHPLEGLLQALVLPLTIMVVPMHIYVILLQLIIMSVSSVINHLEIEVYPPSFQNNPVGKWIIGATHHSLHHKQFKYNFGLYFTFWDKLKHTESPSYRGQVQKNRPFNKSR